MARPSRRSEWESWDWTKQDITLAEQHGLTRERIRQIRVLLGKGDSYNKRRKRKAIWNSSNAATSVVTTGPSSTTTSTTDSTADSSGSPDGSSFASDAISHDQAQPEPIVANRSSDSTPSPEPIASPESVDAGSEPEVQAGQLSQLPELSVSPQAEQVAAGGGGTSISPEPSITDTVVSVVSNENAIHETQNP